jgi:endonuclease-3
VARETFAQARARAVRIFRKLGGRPSKTMLGQFSAKYDPWKILIGTILSARSRDEVTERVADDLFARYPDAKRLARARSPDVQKILKRIGFYRQKTKAVTESSRMICEEFGGKVPSSFEELVKFPGVGRKVAGCVRVYAFGLDAIPVDTHVHRISNRLGLVKTNRPEETEQELMKLVPRRHWQTVNDTLVSYGKTVCKPIRPLCRNCLIVSDCRYPAKSFQKP